MALKGDDHAGKRTSENDEEQRARTNEIDATHSLGEIEGREAKREQRGQQKAAHPAHFTKHPQRKAST